MNHLNLELIKKAYENDSRKIHFGKNLRFDQVEWLIKQAEKVERYESALKGIANQKPTSLTEEMFVNKAKVYLEEK